MAKRVGAGGRHVAAVNLKSRLARLEQVAAPPQGAYPHLPPLVAFPAEGGDLFQPARV